MLYNNLTFLFVVSCVCFVIADNVELFENADSLLACMEELGVTEEQVQEMEDATAPNDDYSCFFGCYLLKENIICENGQMNETTAAAYFAEIEDANEKAKMESIIADFSKELSEASDTCSAGKVGQKYGYSRM
ncbi:uncharacterized protein LOC116343603 [Contarinia nasturtii]|uniref:uncharacterized protein LOC116343603 n=1 Tax=Contarinia nasturtii TaxID=265458 RepID=UPI0012D3C889|nr:uncharacterized protein LOC116343603 [Contarinia nasturtii]